MSSKSSSRLNTHVQVILSATSARGSNSIAKALIPDNVNFPKGLSLKMRRTGPVLTVDLEGRKVGIPTVLATLDEILEHVSVSEKVIS